MLEVQLPYEPYVLKVHMFQVNTCLGVEQRPHYAWFNFNNAIKSENAI